MTRQPKHPLRDFTLKSSSIWKKSVDRKVKAPAKLFVPSYGWQSQRGAMTQMQHTVWEDALEMQLGD